jgi:hypothetical protein
VAIVALHFLILIEDQKMGGLTFSSQYLKNHSLWRMSGILFFYIFCFYGIEKWVEMHDEYFQKQKEIICFNRLQMLSMQYLWVLNVLKKVK